MSTLTIELAQILSELDERSAQSLERLVRDAMGFVRLTQPDNTAVAPVRHWPTGYFEQTAGSFADEPFDIPDDPPPDVTPEP